MRNLNIHAINMEMTPAIEHRFREKMDRGKLKKYLSAHKDIEKKLDKNRTVTFYSTDVAGNFSALGSKFFGKKINAKRASLT